MLDQHVLLLQLALGGDYFVGEESKLTDAPNTDDLLNGPAVLLELGLDSVHAVLDKLSLLRIGWLQNQSRCLSKLQWCGMMLYKRDSDELPCVDAVWDCLVWMRIVAYWNN